MRSRILTGFLLVAVLLTPACNDLTQYSENEPTVESFWSNGQEAELGLMGAYNVLQAYNGTFKRWTFFNWDQRSDVAMSTSPWVDLANISKYTYSSYNFDPNYQTWFDQYSGVFRANQVITNVAQIPDDQIDAQLRDQIIAEGRFLRALMYFNLTVLYGDVPMPLEPLPPSARPEQVPASEVWAQIERDLLDARQHLPSKGEYGPENQGRATWGAATALLARSYLQQRKWEEAAAMYEEVIESGDYQLLSDYADLFDTANENSAESVFEVQFTDDSRLASGISGDWRSQQCGPPGLGWGDCEPTQWFFDLFDDEMTAAGEEDPRKAVTFFYPGSPPMYGLTYEQQYPNGGDKPYWRKYTEYFNETPVIDSSINKLIIRYGMVLLHYAEALNELGRQAEAAEYIQMVRNRVNMPDRQAEFATMSQTDLREEIEREQLLEMGAENVRILYLLRHNLFETEIDELIAHDPEFENWQPGRELLPIPQTEVDMNPNVEQNPGW